MLGLTAGIGKGLLSGSGESEKKDGSALAKSMFDKKEEREEKNDVEKSGSIVVIKREKVSYPT